jgi:HEPN domain-containing protein
MEQKDIVAYWVSTSNSDLEVAHNLFVGKRYSYSLFFTHLSVEKLLKGLIVEKTSQPAPYEHNLVRLAEATYEYAEKYIAQAEQLIQWLKKHFQNT